MLGGAIAAVIFSVIFASLFYLRMIPAINNTVEFILDCSFNYRMTTNVLKNGDVPAMDKLSTSPEGKNIKALLPTGMYKACVFFHKVVNRFKAIPLNVSILLFCAFCGSLIFIPSYFISYEIYHSRIIAYLTAFLSGIIPAYLNRSICYWYRYEILATPILFTSLLFFIKAFKASDIKKTFIHSIISAILILMALYIWRLSILFLIVYVIAFLYLWIKTSEFSKKWLVTIFTVLGVYLLLLLFIPGFGLKNPTSDYGTFPKAAFQIILHNMGIKQNFSEFTRLVYYNQELGGVRLSDMFGWLFLSFSGIFVISYIFFYFSNKVRANIERDILFVFIVFFTILTFIFSRNKIILGPLAALTLGESVDAAFRYKKTVRFMILALITIAFIKTGYDSYRLAVTRYTNTKIGPYLKQALIAINKFTASDSVILSYWADGYPIQTYCNRPTITDGLFESPEIVKRIIAESRIYYSYNEEELWNFCKQYGVTNILVPANRKMAYAGYAGVDYGRYYQKNLPTTLGRLTNLSKLLYEPKELKRFHSLYRNNEFILYAVIEK